MGSFDRTRAHDPPISRYRVGYLVERCTAIKNQPRKDYVTDDGARADKDAPKPTSSLRRVTMRVRRDDNTETEAASQATVTDSHPPDDPYIGSTIDERYEVEALIGEGGMGVVYRCRHIVIGKAVAMKVLRPEMARNEEVTERFLNEARSASLIGNSHIIDISDFGRLPDRATYIVMEFLEGIPLSTLLQEGAVLDFERTVKIVLQLAEGLDAAHQAGIVHRDLKPDNIFLLRRDSQTDFVKILDFGVAKANHPGNQLTQAGQVFGTPHYMSPEQASGSAVDHRSDIYSLGVILYEMMTGTLPFDAENQLSILSQHIHDAPPPPSSVTDLQQPIPAALEQIALRCLAKTPEDRFQTMGEFATALYQVFGTSLGSSYPLPSAAALAGVSAGTQPISSFPAPTSPKKNKRLNYVLGALALAFITVAAYLALPQEEELTSQDAQEVPSAETIDTAAEKNSALAPGKSVTPSTSEPEKQTESKSLVQVAIAVSPLKAHVFLNDKDLGSSPVVLNIGQEPLVIEARAAGYESETVTVDGKVEKLRIVLKPTPQAAKKSPPVPRSQPRRSTTPKAKPKPTPTPKPKNETPEKKRSFGGGELVNPFD
ncbi:MAG: serine/threonine protein kinase [Polyangiaceae bacterium]|nr:serine/threonine protein kinase [Polyangiaceae bacterium]